MTEVRQAVPDDLGTILGSLDAFWGRRDLRHLHHPMFVHQFADTSLVAHDAAGTLVGYLFGFVTPDGEGYVHLIAVRDTARGDGVGRALHERFAAVAAGRGATALRAITTPGNAGSIAFHRRLGYSVDTVADYAGPGADRVVFRHALTADTEPDERAADGVTIGPARPDDAGELLTLQRAAFLPEVVRYGGQPIPPVTETVEEIRAVIATGAVLVAREGGRLIGTVRATRDGTEGRIGRLAVAPDRQGRGLGGRLLRAGEALLTDVERYVLFTGAQSDANVGLYRHLGYRETHRALDAVGVAVVHLARPVVG